MFISKIYGKPIGRGSSKITTLVPPVESFTLKQGNYHGGNTYDMNINIILPEEEYLSNLDYFLIVIKPSPSSSGIYPNIENLKDGHWFFKINLQGEIIEQWIS